jgi:peptidoglycan LD-endopeptidase LytH
LGYQKPKKYDGMALSFTQLVSRLTPYPVLGEAFSATDFAPIDLSVRNPRAEKLALHTFTGLERYVAECHRKTGAKVLYGGYLEHRVLYQQSAHFSGSAELRNRHLGLDLWCAAGTPVFCPLPATVHSFRYNDQPLDYGATLILRHQIDNFSFFTLYGHLSRSSITAWESGQSVAQGDCIASFGPPEENGGWVPHLHWQVILDMEGWSGDYPGVCTEKDLPHYQINCPNPSVLFPMTLNERP